MMKWYLKMSDNYFTNNFEKIKKIFKCTVDNTLKNDLGLMKKVIVSCDQTTFFNSSSQRLFIEKNDNHILKSIKNRDWKIF